MGVEKGGSKGNGFFHLFDWNRKSRKKLFNISPEGTKQGKRIDETLPSIRLRMIDDDDLVGVSSSIKGGGSSDYSCASSVTDEDLTKAPGVVARLMGLDSMPHSTTSEPYCTPFRDTRSFRESNNNQHRIENSGYMRRPVDLRAQKMPSSPIERFQMEALPSRSGKPLPMTYHHKLLSPIKNPGFTSARNAAQIMEAAAKILEPSLEPRLQSVGGGNNGREKVCSFGQNRVRASRLLQLSRVTVESSENNRFNRGNGEEDIVIFRSSPDPYEVGNVKGGNGNSNNSKGKSVSLAVQAKVNVQKREGVNLSIRHSNSNNVQKEHDDLRVNQTFRSQSGNGNSVNHHQRTNMKQQKKQIGGNNSSVLKQNNQKQNCMANRNKSNTGKSGSNLQGRKGVSCESSSSSCSKHKSLSRLSNSSKPPRNINNSVELEKEATFSSNKDFPQKKRLIERTINNNSDNNNNNNNNNKHEQCGVQQKNVVIDEFLNDNTTDVVSFTFTSPLVKQSGNGNGNPQCQIRANGDALSLLLEQKLRELTARSEPTNDFGRCINFGEFEDVGSVENGRRNGFSKDAGIFNFTKHHTLEVVEKGECSNNSMDLNRKEFDQLSPLSVLDEETFVTNESYCTSQDSTCSDASKISPSSVQAQHNFFPSKKVFSSDTETNTKLADSACSALQFFDITPVKHPKPQTDPQLEYISEILSNTELERKAVQGAELDSPLFEKLERKRCRSKMESDITLSQADRRLLFDCVNECLDKRITCHFNKGKVAVREGGLSGQVYGEICSWRNMAELNVDGVVERDMGTGLGTWRDFRVEEFEAGADLEAQILDSLINEMVCDVMKWQR